MEDLVSAGQISRARSVLAVLLVALVVFVSTGQPRAQAQSIGARPEVRVLLAQVSAGSGGDPAIAALRAKFPDAVVGNEASALMARAGPGILIATDAWSLRVLCTVSHPLPIVSVFLPAIEFERAAAGCRSKLVTAVYADAHPSDVVRLVTDALGSRARILSLLPTDAPNTKRLLQTAADRVQQSLAIETVPDQANVARVLARAQPFDVVLALADSSLQTPANVRTLLEATYRRGVGMVGFSPSAARAGMLAAAYATPDDSLAVLEDVLKSFAQSGLLPPPRYPKTWRLAVNETVARSLSIPIPTEWIVGVPLPSSAPK